MKTIKLYLLILLTSSLALPVKAQIPNQAKITTQHKFDIYPVFLADGTDFDHYLTKHLRKASFNKDIKQSFVINIEVDSAGMARLSSISPSNFPDVSEVFRQTISESPRWTPAILNGHAVMGTYFASFNVEFDKTRSRLDIQPLGKARMSKNIGDEIFTAVEHNPQYPGGPKEFDRFIHSNMKFPDAARERNVSGIVYIQVIVEKDGELTSLQVIKDPGFGLGHEAMRLLCMTPKWIPGLQNATPVRVQLIIPVIFFPSKH